MDDEAFRTLLCGVEAIVNSRLLSVENLNDPSLEPLTPNHVSTMKTKVVLSPPGMFESNDLYTKKRWRRVQHLANEFWTRWRKKFLLRLQQRKKWKEPRRNLAVNNLVIVKDDALPRNCWQLARVSRADIEKDGYVRKVQVVLGDRHLSTNGKKIVPIKYLERPIQKLILLIPCDDQAE